jgi:hypothetical protein
MICLTAFVDDPLNAETNHMVLGLSIELKNDKLEAKLKSQSYLGENLIVDYCLGAIGHVYRGREGWTRTPGRGKDKSLSRQIFPSLLMNSEGTKAPKTNTPPS